jgi:hypothetical protein
MSRRVVGVALAGTGALLGIPASHAATVPPPLLPMPTCETRVNDISGDGVPTFNVVNVNNVPTISDPRGNITALDIRSITLRLTATRVYAFMGLNEIPDTFPATDSAYGYIMWFTYNGKTARFDQVYANPSLQAQGLAPRSGFPAASVGSTQSGGTPLTGVGGGVDTAKNVAYVYADRSSLETQLGIPIADGDDLTAISGRTELWETDGTTAPGVVRRPADSTDATGDKATWQAGDDRCFPPSTITVAKVSAQYGDPATLTATLADAAGTPMADREVTLTVAGAGITRTLTTDADGAVRVALDAAPPAGTYPIQVRYAGDDWTGAGDATATLTVKPETVRIAKLAVKAAGSSRTVTATLTEDDPRAFARQPVAWYVNGKKVATTSTDAAGRAVFTGAKPGQKVQARYAGQAGRYAAATSNIVTA